MSAAPLSAHWLQHVPFEGLGQLEPRLRHAGFQIGCTRLFDSIEWPEPAAIDFLVVMGGPMSVNDEGLYPWLKEEKDFIRRYLATGKPLLGICLGAQLLANVLDARVRPNREKEIGWFPIDGISQPETSPHFRFPATAEVFHWHGETFDLPSGAAQLARSQACENQAFQIGSAIGLQFHLETTPESARALIEHARNELVPGAFVQSEAEILAVPANRYPALHRLLDDLLAHQVPAVGLRLS